MSHGKHRVLISIHAPPRGATRNTPRALCILLNFNSRPSARGDSRTPPKLLCIAGFQFTPLREGRPEGVGQSPTGAIISIHAPPRGATALANCQTGSGHISIHAPPRGATFYEGSMHKVYTISIHAPPRGATVSLCTASRSPAISIHAPPRGATTLALLFGDFVNISIHAPPRGATRRRRTLCKPDKQFQFTPLREGRRESSQRNTARRRYFNSRPSARGDASCTRFRSSGVLFQFTPLREGRPARQYQRQRYSYFNSRPSARGDLAVPRWFDSDVFQFTPLREGRLFAVLMKTYFASFQFTPLREGRQRSYGLKITTGTFQFTPLREGRRQVPRGCAKEPPISIHAPPRGATSYKSYCGFWALNFNSRPSARGDLIPSVSVHLSAEFQFTPLREGRHGKRFGSGKDGAFQFTPLREGRHP